MQKNDTKQFNDFIQNGLNAAQRMAVEHVDGPVLVVAGAGSGKTRVITARIAHLMINHAATHESIIALTFTNKAAKEMQERISGFLPTQSTLPFVGTFHAYCLQLLKKNQEHLETPFFSILDADDQQKLIGSILKFSGAQKQVTPKNALYQISHIKNNLVQYSADELFAQQQPYLRDLYQAYEQEKRASKSLDFDDLLLETLKLFNKNVFKERFHDTIQHVLVDEYQDTNVVQHELLKKMALKGTQCIVKSLCAVGDEDQSIYSWRGATVANMNNFCTDFKKTKIIKVEQNYRSVQSILTAANTVIAHNSARTPKKLWSEKQGTDRIRSILCSSEYQEADAIAQLLQLVSSHKALSSVAILYRTHMQSRALEEACIKRSIPYKMVGGVQFYERKEIKDLLAYLRLIVNPFDRTSFMRVINCPARGLGSAFESLVYERWQREPFHSFIELLNTLIKEHEIKGVKEAAVTQFMHCFADITPQHRPSEALEQLVVNTGYITHLKNSYEPQDAETRIANVNELINAVRHLQTEEKVTSIEQLLDEIALMQEKASHTNEEHQAVTLMTLHAAKGLEFDLVILAGLEDGILPSTRSFNSSDALEEERRLFYVGITRARERLLLSHSRYRYAYGQMTDQMPSRFLQEVPSSLMHSFDLRHKDAHTEAFFADWLGITRTTSPVLTFSGARNLQQSSFRKRTQKAATTDKAPPSKRSTTARYRKNQAVHHKKYGIGLIQKVEAQSDGSTYITAKFKAGLKKILDSFLQVI